MRNCSNSWEFRLDDGPSSQGRAPHWLGSLQIYTQPDSAESEAFRTLRTALSLSDQPSHRLVITSSEPGDGKTTVLANLAVCFAQADKKTLLIDADLRRPGLSGLLGLRGIDGLSTVIRGQGTVVELAATHIRGFRRGRARRSAGRHASSDAAELLAASLRQSWPGRRRCMIKSLSTAPTLAASDTAVVGRLCDGAILVVQPERIAAAWCCGPPKA